MNQRKTDGRILGRREYDEILDTIPSLPARLAAHQHDALMRQRLEDLEGLERTEKENSAPDINDILAFIRSRAAGRESTVRGQTILKLANEIEDHYRAA